MAATPKLTSAMMQGGGVYDSIIGQTSTPRASEKVLMFLDRIAPSEPVDNVVVWTDDEEPADPRLHMFAPEHRRKGHRPQSVSTENEKLLDELAQSEMSYPHDEHGKKNSGGQRKSVEDRLEGYGSRGWTPQVQAVPMSPVDQYAMPTARPAGGHSRQGSRVPSRMGRPASAAPPSRPGSVRPAYNRPGDFPAPKPTDEDFLRYGAPNNALSNPHNNALNATPPVALQIDIKAASIGTGDMEHHGPRSLAETDQDLYAAADSGTPRVRSPTGVHHMFGRRESPVAPLRSPFRGNQGLHGSGVTPQGLAASVPLPHSRTPSAMAYSRPGSRMAAGNVRGEDSDNLPLVQHEDHGDRKRHKHRSSDPPLTAAAYETPWFHRTQYGKHDPPVVVSTLRLKLVDPPPPVPPKSPPKTRPRTDMHKAPRRDSAENHVRQVKTPVASRPVLEIDPSDEHVHGHVHEVVGEEPDVYVNREELVVRTPTEDDYGQIEGDDIGHHVQEHYDVVDNRTYRSVTPKARAVVPAASEPGLADLPETEIVDVDVENMNERQLVEHLRTPAMRSEPIDYTDEVQRALDLHHDEDLCVLLQAAEDELQHPVVRKAVRKAIAGRLRKLGLSEDYDAVKKDPRQAAKLAQEAYGSPKSIMAARLPDDAPEWARRLSESVRELTRQMQATQIGQPRRIKGPGKDGSAAESDHDDSLHPGHAIDERGMQYRPDTEADTEGLLNIEPPAAGLVSPGEMLYDEEVYKLRKRNAHGTPRSHATWEIEEEMAPGGGAGSVLAGEEGGMPEIPNSDFYRDSPTKGRGHRRQESGSQTGGVATTHGDNEGLDWVARYSNEPADGPPPWLKVNQRLLNWAVIWPFSELENSLKSCERGEQVDEVALTIWTAQMYKRYVRAQMTTYPPATVDKMFVPPNIADAINNAAYNGRHEEVAVMLRELWVPFGFKGHPKLILALTKHRREENHWVVHRFSLPDASIITYDTFLEKSLPDGRPLGWWFGIRIAFSSDNYPPPDQVVQRMIRLHRPLQLQVDNSLAAAAIWRNLIMGSKADRLVDLDRLRDLVRQEVKGVRGKKEQGKLSLGLAKSGAGSELRAIEA